MPLVPAQKMLSDARQGGYCLAGFDVFNFELLEAVIKTCERLRSPVMIQTSFMNFDFYELKNLSAMLLGVMEKTSVPVTLHLDHGPREMPIEIIKGSLDAGFPSVMADGSESSLEENIALMKKIVAMAKPYGAAVEAELGQVSRDPSTPKEQIIAMMTKPEEAKRFVEETGIDSLAVAVGSVTACFDSSQVEIDFGRLQQISEQVSIPLVFHGGTGIPDDAMKEAIKLGVAKVNVAHGLRNAFINVVRGGFSDTEGYVDPRPILAESINKISSYVEHKLELYGSIGKAD